MAGRNLGLLSLMKGFLSGIVATLRKKDNIRKKTCPHAGENGKFAGKYKQAGFLLLSG